MTDSAGEAPGSSLEKASILVVDDRAGNLVAMESVLEALGQHVVTARSGSEALRHLLEREFAVVLLDVDMPVMDGFETAGYIRGRDKTAHTPIIFLSAYAEAMHTARGYALGAVDCIIKPVVPEVLRTKVRVFVDLYLMTRAAKRAEAERMTQGMIEAVPNPIFLMGSDGRYRGVNKAWESFFGLPRAAVLGRTLRELFPQRPAMTDWADALLQGPDVHTYDAAIPAPDGSLRDVLCYRGTYGAEQGAPAGVIATLVDITERRQAEKRQAMEHAVTRLLAEAATLDEAMAGVIEIICRNLGWHCGARWHWEAAAGVLRRAESWTVAAAEVQAFDRAIARMELEPRPGGEGLASRAFCAREPVWIADVGDHAGFRRRELALQAGLHAGFAFPLMRGTQVLGVMEFFHRDAGEPNPVLVEVAAVIGSEVGQYIVRSQAEEAVKFLAMHDPLTRLPNRAMFSERLAGAIAQAGRHERALAVLFIDLDKFKVINDTLGHEAGDYVLGEAARRLNENLRGGDTVARLGGDEFVVLLEEIVDPVYVGGVCQKLIEALALPFTIAGEDYRITASIGVSACPDDGSDPESLLKNADTAMYRAKQKGRNGFEFYSAQLSAGAMQRLSLESGLRRALERDELELHYQPQIETCTGRIVGMEALVRWRHPQLGLLMPERFIRIAEENGLIVPLGDWVMRTACMAHREWQTQRIAPERIAVNLSPRQFLHAGLVKDALKVLEQSGCRPNYLEFEITESMVMHDPSGAAAVVDELKAAGVRIAMDDFGTGYSSLAHLKRFAIDTLKIDRSFISDLPHDPGNRAITDAIIAMARTLHLTVIAEGVETRAQFDFLRRLGCDEVQGFYFSEPVPFEQASVLLRDARLQGETRTSDEAA